jgi:hypothetical protein
LHVFLSLLLLPLPLFLLLLQEHEKEEWRTWWVTNGVENENGIPVRDEDEEIQATINQLKLSKSALGGIPVYLVIGNDLGKFTSNIIYKLGNAGEIDVIDGFIYVNRDKGKKALKSGNI